MSDFLRRRRGIVIAIAACVLLALAGAALYAYLRSPDRGLPYHDAFVRGSANEWQAFGGTWEVANGSMRNDSDERGAKLLTGSGYWRNYLIEADIMLLSAGGDAGLIIRSSDEEEGVDAYSGYYAGLRSLDNSLVLGRAGHGWMEAAFKIAPQHGQVKALRWYHLKLLAYGCHYSLGHHLYRGAAYIRDRNRPALHSFGPGRPALLRLRWSLAKCGDSRSYAKGCSYDDRPR